MKSSESLHIIAAIIIITAVIGFSDAFQQNWSELAKAFAFGVIIIVATIVPKKIIASMLDVKVEQRIWSISRWGFASHRQLKPEIPAGIVLPLLLSLFSLGYLKIMPVLKYEAVGLKARAARRFGFFSWLTLTEWHNALIGAAGIVSVLLVSFISYFLPWELEALSKMAAYYALVNIIPYSDLDGTQIIMGSRALWTTLFLLAAIFTVYALVLV